MLPQLFHMKKLFKILGIAVLSVVTLAAVGLVWSYRLSLEPEVDLEWRRNFSDFRILCEWYCPATNGVPAYVEVCYWVDLGVQCYRIEGNQVVNYHQIRIAKEPSPSEMQKQRFYEFLKVMRDAQQSSRPSKWGWASPFVGWHARDMPKTAYDSDDNEDTILSCVISNMTAQVRQYETDNTGYVSMMAWWVPWSWEAVAYPLDEVPSAFKTLRDMFEQCMADPSTHEYHTTYIRGYPIPPPEQPKRVPVLNAWKTSLDFGFRQRDAVQFLMEMGRVLIPIDEGVNPFSKFGVPYVSGNSLIVNYRNEDNDTVLYLHGDNFVRVQVYSGEKPTE